MWLLFLLAVDPNESFDPPSESERRVVRAVIAAVPPEIDGVLDEPLWATAPIANDFRQVEPVQRAKAAYDTEVRVAWDERALYFAIRAYEPNAKKVVRTTSVARDFEDFENDHVAVLIDTLGDGRNATAFSVSAAGALSDYLASDDDNYDDNWDAVWRAKIAFELGAWTIEMAIPWSSLRHKPSETRFGLQVVRRARVRNEVDALAPYPRIFGPARMPYAARLEGFTAPTGNSLSLLLRPYVTLGLDQQPQFLWNIGGDVRLSPAPGLLFEMTANTDFAEVDVDRRVINLSRQTVYFPERRQFFLESGSLMSPGYAEGGDEGYLFYPFFSRRIGLSDEGRRVQMTMGSRLLLRTGSDNAGALVVHTAGNAETPESVFGVLRYSRNLGEQSRIGALGVLRYDIFPDNRGSQVNIVPAVDGLWRLGSFSLEGMGSYSYSDNNTKSGLPLAGYVRAMEERSTHRLAVDVVAVGPAYEAKSGFVGRDDFILVRPNFMLDFRPAWKPRGIRSIRTDGGGNLYLQASTGNFVEGRLYYEPLWIILDNGDEFWVYLQPEWQRLSEPFSPIDGLTFDAGDYRFMSGGAAYFSDPSKKLSFQSWLATGKYYSANWGRIEGAIRYAPIANISLRIGYQVDIFGLVDGLKTAHLITSDVRLALNPRLQLIGFLQWSSQAALGINARLQWEYLPLSFLYVVYTAQGGEHRVVLKALYTFQT